MHTHIATTYMQDEMEGIYKEALQVEQSWVF